MTFDPFTPPTATHSVATAPPRAPVVVAGRVARTEAVSWAGGPVTEVTLTDDLTRNGDAVALTLVFFGRTPMTVQPATALLAAGTIGTHRGRRVMLNPHLWLTAPMPAPLPAVPALTSV